MSRGERGVGILLSLTEIKTYKDSGELLPESYGSDVLSSNNRRFMSINIKFKGQTYNSNIF